MITLPAYDPRNFHLPADELLRPGHMACPGCGAALAMRLALKGLGPDTVMVIPACCWAVIIGPYPYSALEVPVLQVAFETAAISAAGLRAGLDARGMNDTVVVAWAGDGGTFDIGFQALSGAVERNDDILYITYDNEAYMNTGIQRSSATPLGAWTTTTPAVTPKGEPKKNIVEILAEHRIAYAATASVAFPEDLIAKVRRARAVRGARFLHIWIPCPPGHRSEERDTIRTARLAVETGVFPLYQVEHGTTYTIDHEPAFTDVAEYLRLQGRFRHLDDDAIALVRENIAWEWRRLRARVTMGRSLLDAGAAPAR
jgi:pyruvate/2-oxoacid:ferredoxin oxidoreductase beta subunit